MGLVDELVGGARRGGYAGTLVEVQGEAVLAGCAIAAAQALCTVGEASVTSSGGGVLPISDPAVSHTTATKKEQWGLAISWGD